MALTIELEVLDNVAISTTEYSVTNDSTTIATNTADGIFMLFLTDTGTTTQMDKTSEYEIRVLEKVHNGGTQEAIFRATIKGVQSEPFVTPPLPLGNGWDITVKKLAGTTANFDARITQLA